MSDWNKRRTGTNVGLVQRQTRINVSPVQTSAQYKRQTSTNVGLLQTSDQYKSQTNTNVGLRKENYLNF